MTVRVDNGLAALGAMNPSIWEVEAATPWWAAKVRWVLHQILTAFPTEVEIPNFKQPKN